MESKIKIKEECVTEGDLWTGTEFVSECETNRDSYSNDPEMVTKGEPWSQIILNKIKCETTPASDAVLFSEISSVSPEFISCKSETNICSDNEIHTKIETKKEPLCLDTNSTEIMPLSLSDLQLGNKNNNTHNGKDEDWPATGLQRTYNGISSDISIIGNSKKSYNINKKQYNTACENAHIFKSDITGTHSVEEHCYSHGSQDGHTHNGTGSNSILSREEHKNKRLQKCNIIGKSSTQEDKSLLECKICNKIFQRKHHLKRHNLVHEYGKLYNCESCEKSFTSMSNLKRHCLTHESEKPYKCEMCEKSFTQKYALKTHKLTHYCSKLHKCKICEKKFTAYSDLQSHNLSHESLRTHKCDICKKNFVHISALKRHRMIHEGKKPHKCKICEKSFTHIHGLKRHVLVHEGIKPFKCSMCEKSFAHKYTLKMHTLLHGEANMII